MVDEQVRRAMLKQRRWKISVKEEKQRRRLEKQDRREVRRRVK